MPADPAPRLTHHPHLQTWEDPHERQKLREDLTNREPLLLSIGSVCCVYREPIPRNNTPSSIGGRKPVFLHETRGQGVGCSACARGLAWAQIGGCGLCVVVGVLCRGWLVGSRGSPPRFSSQAVCGACDFLVFLPSCSVFAFRLGCACPTKQKMDREKGGGGRGRGTYVEQRRRLILVRVLEAPLVGPVVFDRRQVSLAACPSPLPRLVGMRFFFLRPTESIKRLHS